MMIWLLSLVVLVFGVMGILSKLFGSPKKDPISILNTRLAKGEITKEEYERLKSLLENS